MPKFIVYAEWLPVSECLPGEKRNKKYVMTEEHNLESLTLKEVKKVCQDADDCLDCRFHITDKGCRLNPLPMSWELSDEREKGEQDA